MEEKYKSLQGKTSSLFNMEEEVLRVSKKCESVQLMLEGLGGQRGALRPQLEALELDVGRLKEWASGLTEKRAQLQTSMEALRDAVGQIEGRTSTITMDFANKVASVRTDVRRMDGLHSELESLLAKVGELEDQTTRLEHSMVKRIGDVLTSSMDRVSNLRAVSERNAQAIEQLRRRIPELTTADDQISERLRELESGRARLIRTVTFASDLKPKVAAIKRDFGAFEPQLSDLTLRIGRLAEDLTKREQEITELRQTLTNLTAVEGDLSVTAKQVSEIADISDIGEMHRPT
nr:PREDICTED: inhibitor of nuclear factor kappa-B kinase-interacting protein [Paralichthys olivaceus]